MRGVWPLSLRCEAVRNYLPRFERSSGAGPGMRAVQCRDVPQRRGAVGAEAAGALSGARAEPASHMVAPCFRTMPRL